MDPVQGATGRGTQTPSPPRWAWAPLTLFSPQDDGAIRVWKNFADLEKNPEMVTAWQGLLDMLPTTRGASSPGAQRGFPDCLAGAGDGVGVGGEGDPAAPLRRPLHLPGPPGAAPGRARGRWGLAGLCAAERAAGLRAPAPSPHAWLDARCLARHCHRRAWAPGSARSRPREFRWSPAVPCPGRGGRAHLVCRGRGAASPLGTALHAACEVAWRRSAAGRQARPACCPSWGQGRSQKGPVAAAPGLAVLRQPSRQPSGSGGRGQGVGVGVRPSGSQCSDVCSRSPGLPLA